MQSIRNSAKAIIIEEGRVLAMEHLDSEGKWYVLPGGGQMAGETLETALLRECAEELGVEIQIGQLRCIREYIGKNHEFRDEDGEIHQVEFMFECEIVGGWPPGPGSKPDTGQIGCVWLPLEEIMEHRLYPLAIREVLADLNNKNVQYLGDIN